MLAIMRSLPSLFFLSLLHPPECFLQVVELAPASSDPLGKCKAKEFFSLETGSCAPCAKNQVTSADGLGCACEARQNGTNGPVAHCRDCSNLPPSTLWESIALDASFLACNNTCNVTACQMLTNLVVLKASTLQSRAYDLYRKTKSPDLPELWYSNLRGASSKMVFGKNSKINLKVTKYNIHGTFLGWEDVRGATLQLCPGRPGVLDAAFLFGTSYSRSCTLEASDLLQGTPAPIFYEMFLQFEDEKGNTHLWPVPVENPAMQASGQASPSQELRRFFLVDGISGRKDNLTDPPSSVTFAAEMLLSVHLPTQTSADHLPFRLTVNYAKRSREAAAQVSFSVSYSQNLGTAVQATDIALGSLGFVALLYALLRTSSWARRSRLPNLNLVMVVKFSAFFAGSLANAFFLVTIGTGVYWLIVFKGQQFSDVEVTLPAAGSQIETNFLIYLLVALALKSMDLVHLLITQLRISIFLIDWEKPKERRTAKAPAGDQRPPSSASAWRTFLIANEWNEIQTHRKANPSLHLLAVLLLLEVVGLKNLASRDLNVDLHPGPDTHRAPWSPILRFGVAASVWLVVWIVQVFFVGFYERFVEDKIHQFVDLCSLSNVSVFILMDGCYGFYLHGRSVHGHADVDMYTMHSYLRKEEENLCALRGLESYSDVQTFEVFLTDRTRRFYDRISLSFLEQLPGGPRGQPDLHEQRLRSYYGLNRFLVSFLEHRYKDMDYVVKDKFLLERIMDMEFQEPGELSVLYNDDRALFSRTLFYNHELLLTLFEILLFSAVDLGAQDFVLATIVTFVVQKLVKMLRNTLGRRNLAEKTLVEKHFLI